MFDPFGSQKLETARKELQESLNKMLEFHERLKVFLLALKGLGNPDVDRIFEEHQVKVIVKVMRK